MPSPAKRKTQMSSLTELDLKQIEQFTAAASTNFPGLLADESPQGRSNAQAIVSFLVGHNQQFTLANLNAAVVILQYVLSWSPGLEPSPVASVDTRSQSQRAHDGGIPTHRDTHTDTSESGWARDIRAGQAANAARLANKKRDDERFRELHQVVMSPNGRVSHAETEALRKAAAQRHAEENARESGRPVAAATGFRVIGDGETDFSKYQPEEIKAYLARKKSGGRLMR
jgi:hypothetical protein